MQEHHGRVVDELTAESIHVHAEIANDGHWLDNAVVDTDRDRNLNNPQTTL